MQILPKNVSVWTQGQSFPGARTRKCWVHAPKKKAWSADYIGGDKIQNAEICQITVYAASVQVQYGLFTCDEEEQILSLLKKFAVPEIVSRPWAEACCFSKTCDFTSQNDDYIPSWIGSTDETPLYFSMLSNYAVDDIAAKRVVMKTSGNEKM